MPLPRATDQFSVRGIDLYGFYEEIIQRGAENGNARIGKQMLELLPLLEGLCAGLSVWGLTSLHRLVLLAEDSYKSPWYVIVAANAYGGYWIQYQIPEEEAPWPRATVSGEANEKETACEMVRIAMERSGGWRFAATA